MLPPGILESFGITRPDSRAGQANVLEMPASCMAWIGIFDDAMSDAGPSARSLDDVPRIPVSWGELVDKLTILEIKSERLTGAEALANVELERRLLDGVAARRLAAVPRLQELRAELRAVNRALWDIENDIRQKDALHQFDDRFVELARSVYQKNDQRASLKRSINELLGSAIVEEKSYVRHDGGANAGKTPRVPGDRGTADLG